MRIISLKLTKKKLFFCKVSVYYFSTDPCVIPKHVKMSFSLDVLSCGTQKERCATLCIGKPGISAISAASVTSQDLCLFQVA